MYCGRCGATDNGVTIQEVGQDGNTVTISYFGKCKRCGEPLGIKEFFVQTDWDYIDPKIVNSKLRNGA